MSFPLYCISKPTWALSKSHRYLSSTARSYNVDHRASSKLFADADREGTPPRPTVLPRTAPEHPNWTGEERIEDAVLRMLVDKYKPLRTGTVQTAEEKMRRPPPTMLPISEAPPPSPPSPSRLHVYRANEPLLPAVEGHKPWLTTFKVPSHATTSIRYGQFPTSPSSSASGPSQIVGATTEQADDHQRRRERDAKKRSEITGRLTRAKESTLDYRLGIKNASSGRAQPNPVSIKGWAGLVEERIERARREGLFRSIRGRGRPLERNSEEHNPFIARDEFLMNRIVRRQGAAPPWVEVQGELEVAVAAFRTALRRSWVRRAVRVLALTHSRLSLPSLADVRALRDGEWESRERAYHDSALVEVNSLVRKYNALAPYAVRRAYYVREVELANIYDQSAEEIVREIEGRPRDSRMIAESETTPGGDVRVLKLRNLFWQWIRRRT
ncbi:hypothetical protein EDB92DRAFT_1804643 [Lactarius akahatsu]|uniref:DnaJ homologue subfamily C member 28 conserved domain-containing protein n=1 Tax=Lactarius akahatsu TaxID=416441 RepID=A0AAD4L901_9AGAM|nr:hypothetical protein EDB92DRAFT_1804643 [Lactarius akahatsu]